MLGHNLYFHTGHIKKSCLKQALSVDTNSLKKEGAKGCVSLNYNYKDASRHNKTCLFKFSSKEKFIAARFVFRM